MAVRLQGSGEWDALWGALTDHADRLNLRHMRLNINAPALYEAYHASWERTDAVGEGRGVWRVEIPLAARGAVLGHLEVAGLLDDEPVWRKVAVLTQCLDESQTALLPLACTTREMQHAPHAVAGPHVLPLPGSAHGVTQPCP
jgi:hypothetical protein